MSSSSVVSLTIPGDCVAEWSIHLPDGIHKVEFEHGTATGKRLIRVDGQEVLRKNWMFSLVGQESFKIADKPASVSIDSEGLAFIYRLHVNGQTLKQFHQSQNKQMRAWLPIINGENHRIVLDTKTMDIYVNGIPVQTVGEFVEDGAKNHFEIEGKCSAYIKSYSSNCSGRKQKGLLYKLVLNNGEELEPVPEVD